MEKILITVIFVIFSTNAIPVDFTSCDKSRQLYDVSGSLNVGGEEGKELMISGEVVIEQLQNYTVLQVIELSMTDSEQNTYPNPIDLDKPVKILMKDSGDFSLESETNDSRTSIAIKQHIIRMLPRQAFMKAADSPNLTKIKATQDLLKRGDQEIILSDDYKELILVLGNTGSGKSTLTQWIAGDSSRLEAKEVVIGEYIIEDNLGRIGNSTIDSKTTFPELIVDLENNYAYYDFPGFSDTRDSSYDIASSYFIKRVLDHAKAVKMLFVVSYPSVRKGVDRQDFLKLLRHLSELVIDMNKFSKSIALVVTKVDNVVVYERGLPYLVNDRIVIEGIAKFLEDAKIDLKRRDSSTSNPSSKDKTFYMNSISFINAILEQKNNNYTRIGIFRRPSEPGPLSKMSILQREKKRILNIIHTNLKYTEKISNDFGRTISDRSKNDIIDLIQEIDKNILFSTCTVAEKINIYFLDLQIQIESLIKNINTSDIAVAGTHLKSLGNLFSNFIQSFDIIKELTNTIKNTKNREDVTQLISETLTSLELPAVTDLTKEMLTQGRHSKFLQSISNMESNSRISSLAWAAPFQNMLINQSATLSRTQNEIKNIESEISKQVQFELSKVGKDLVELFSKEENTLHDIHGFVDKIKFYYHEMNYVVNLDKKPDYIDYVMKITKDLKINTLRSVKTYLTSDERHFEKLKSVMNEVFKYLYNSQMWYKFLDHLYEKLLTYKIQRESSKYYEMIKKTYQPGDDQMVSELGLEADLQEIFSQEYKSIYETVKNISLNRNKINNLAKVVNVALRRPEQSCIGNKMIIKGIVIKTADVLQSICPYEVNLVEIYAATKIIVDTDIKEENKDLTIIAPTWEIQGKRNIQLLGKAGLSHKESKAPNGQFSSDDGKDGKPGLPGYRGGNFLGIGKMFINSEQLTVSSIGGKGGSGQNGGDGAPGADGDIKNSEQLLEDVERLHRRGKYNCRFLCFRKEYDTLVTGGCTNGGKPGLGGAGGLGGYPGKITIISTNDNTYNITTETVFGDKGKTGSPGSEGKAGRPGKYVKCNWCFLRSVLTDNPIDCTTEDANSCRDGEKLYGLSGVNSENQYLPDSFSTINEVDAVNEFTSFLSRIYNDTVTASDIKCFLGELENGVPGIIVPNIPNFDETKSYNNSESDTVNSENIQDNNISVSMVETTKIPVTESNSIENYDYGDNTIIDPIFQRDYNLT